MNVYDFMTYACIHYIHTYTRYDMSYLNALVNFALSLCRHLMFTNLLGILIFLRYVIDRYKTKFKQMTPRRSWHLCAVLWARQGSSSLKLPIQLLRVGEISEFNNTRKDVWCTLVIYIYIQSQTVKKCLDVSWIYLNSVPFVVNLPLLYLHDHMSWSENAPFFPSQPLKQTHTFECRMLKILSHFPYHPCMWYLPTFTIKINHSCR